jgi:hypothetical protein
MAINEAIPRSRLTDSQPIGPKPNECARIVARHVENVAHQRRWDEADWLEQGQLLRTDHASWPDRIRLLEAYKPARFRRFEHGAIDRTAHARSRAGPTSGGIHADSCSRRT